MLKFALSVLSMILLTTCAFAQSTTAPPPADDLAQKLGDPSHVPMPQPDPRDVSAPQPNSQLQPPNWVPGVGWVYGTTNPDAVHRSATPVWPRYAIEEYLVFPNREMQLAKSAPATHP